MELRLLPDGQPGIFIFDQQKQGRIMLALIEDEGRILVNDANGAKRVELLEEEEGSAVLRIFDRHGDQVARIP